MKPGLIQYEGNTPNRTLRDTIPTCISTHESSRHLGTCNLSLGISPHVQDLPFFGNLPFQPVGNRGLYRPAMVFAIGTPSKLASETRSRFRLIIEGNMGLLSALMPELA